MKCENETFKKNVINTVSRGIYHLAYIYKITMAYLQTEILLIIINTYLFLLIIKIFYDDTNK